MRITRDELAALAAGGLTARWLYHALFHPFGPCRRCDGTGKNRGSTGKRWGRCWRCSGSGHKQVIGSRAIRRLWYLRRGLADRKGKR